MFARRRFVGSRAAWLAATVAVLLASATACAEDRSYCDRGDAAYRAGNLDGAIADYDRCLSEGQLSASGQAAAYTTRGMAYSRKAQLDRAIADYDAAIKLDTSAAAAFLSRGMAQEL